MIGFLIFASILSGSFIGCNLCAKLRACGVQL